MAAQLFFAQKISENDLGAFNSSFGDPWTELRPDEHLVVNLLPLLAKTLPRMKGF